MSATPPPFRHHLGRALSALILLAAACAGVQAAAAPRVVASFLPLQSLAAGVMAGIGKPESLIHGAGSPHTYALRPSEARELSRANVVFWIGPTYESFLAKPIEARGTGARAVSLIQAPGVEVLKARRGGAWEADADEAAGEVPAEEADPHVFLDPRNAEAMVRAMATTLAAADPAHAAQYRANADATIARLAALDRDLAQTFEPVRGVPFVVFHDGTQYLEHRYGLAGAGSVVVSPERPPGARRIAEIHARIETVHAACVFAEPQFESALVRTVAAGTAARTGVLDYVGVDLKPGPDAYFEMMRALGHSLAGCLGDRRAHE